MTKSSSSSLFSKSQQRALAALKLPLWVARESVAKAEENCARYYRVNAWLLKCETTMPVDRPSWLQDLESTLAADSDASLAEVAPTTVNEWPSEKVIPISGADLEQLSEQRKRQIWQQIVSAS